jgi:hypothetical protein
MKPKPDDQVDLGVSRWRLAPPLATVLEEGCVILRKGARHRVRRAVIAVGVVIASVAGASTGLAGPHSRGSGDGDVCRAWTTVLNARILGGFAEAVSADSSSDAWVVGFILNKEDYFMEHWDGRAWTEVPHPDVRGAMAGTVAIKPTDAWAVGRDSALPTHNALIEHWDGTAWTVSPSPVPGTNGYLSSVDATSSDDVWTVGNYTDPHGFSAALIEHWDGEAWTVVPGDPNPGQGGFLLGVSALSSTDVWAVGYQAGGIPLIEHWDGTAWTEVDPEYPPPGTSILYAVSAVSAQDVWTVGDATDGAPFIEHWDGTAWTKVPSPRVVGSLRGVAGISVDDVWAVGALVTDGEYPLTQHWDGISWKNIKPATPVRVGAVLFAVDAYSSTDVWAVGVQSQPQTQLAGPLIEHSSGPCT